LPLDGWKSASLREKNVKRLRKIAGKLQAEKGEKVSLNDALEQILDKYERVEV
jgi:hypothetical protein